MQLKPESWHFRLFVQAYIKDRGWLLQIPDRSTYDKESEPYKAYKAYWRELDAPNPEGDRNPVSLEQHYKLRELEGAIHEYEFNRERQRNAERGPKIREQLLSGRMSLCPYFWSVVYALLMYRAGRVVGKAADRVLFPVLGVLAVLTAVGVAVLFVGYTAAFIRYQGPDLVRGVYETSRTIGSGLSTVPSKAVALPGNMLESYHDWQQRRVVEAEWRKANAAALEREAQELKEYRDRRNQEDWAQFKTDLSEGLELAGWVTVYVVGTISVFLLCWLLFMGAVALVERFFRIPRVQKFMKLAYQVVQDTNELVFAFMRAKKEKVCPYLEISGTPTDL